MGHSSFRVAVLFTVSFLATAFLFQNCEFTTTDQINHVNGGKQSANLNGVPYTGVQPIEGTYYALGVCPGHSSQSVIAQVEIVAGSSQGQLIDTCSNSSRNIDVEDLFYRSYSQDYLSYQSAIFQYIENFDANVAYEKAQFVCWLGPGNGGTETSGINLVLKDNSQFVDYIVTSEFSESGQDQIGTLDVARLNPVESGPEAGWIFVEGADYEFIITDTLNERELYTATFSGIIESQEILFEFECQKQF